MTIEKDIISTHLIFGQNLRELCKRSGTIAEVADQLDINRVQMNRILNGESFPKPGLLKRICELFGVDARILLQPLSELEAEKKRNLTGTSRLQAPLTHAFFDRDYSVHPSSASQEVIPDGIHLVLRPSFLWADGYWVGLVRFFSKGGARVIKGFDPMARGMRRRDLTPQSSREYRGVLLNTGESISFLYSIRIPTTVLGMDHYNFRSSVNYGFLAGLCFIMSGSNPSGRSVVPSILQPIEQNSHEILKAARLSGFRGLDELPKKYHSYLSATQL